MSWNYRIIKHPGPDDTEWWGIHEVYYDGHGNIESYTERPDVVGHGLDDLLGTITLLAEARINYIKTEEVKIPQPTLF